MINSMTGYGRSMMHLDGADITVEIKAVNNRFLDVNVRLPRSLSYCEDKIKSFVQSSMSRGKTDVFVTYVRTADEEVEIIPNLGVAKGYYNAIRAIDEALGTDSRPDALSLSRFPDVFTVKAADPDEDGIWKDVSAVLVAAMENFNGMRAAEGEKMAQDVLDKLSRIEELTGAVEEKSAPRLEAYRQKLTQRMLDVLGTSGIDEKRILEEAAIYADHTAVDEETVRLHSHIGQFRDIVKKGGPVGRKLDFLTQEINREINTIGSKAADLEITGYVVELKGEAEKIREQIQNIE